MTEISKDKMVPGTVYYGVFIKAPRKPSKTKFFTNRRDALEYKEKLTEDFRERYAGCTNMISIHRAVVGGYND